jgi:hypothetical protein
MRNCSHSVAQPAVTPGQTSLADHVVAIAVTATAAVACRGDKSFFLVAAVGGAALLGGLYLFLNSQL